MVKGGASASNRAIQGSIHITYKPRNARGDWSPTPAAVQLIGEGPLNLDLKWLKMVLNASLREWTKSLVNLVITEYEYRKQYCATQSTRLSLPGGKHLTMCMTEQPDPEILVASQSDQDISVGTSVAALCKWAKSDHQDVVQYFSATEEDMTSRKERMWREAKDILKTAAASQTIMPDWQVSIDFDDDGL